MPPIYSPKARLIVLPDYINRVSALSVPLQLLLENEMYRLSIWDNPVNEARRGTDYVPHTERSMVDVRALISTTSSNAYAFKGFLDRSCPYPVGD